MKVNLILRKRDLANGLRSLVYDVSLGRGNQFQVATDLQLNPKYWNADTRKVGARHPNQETLNKAILKQKRLAEDCKIEYDAGTLNNREQVTNYLKGIVDTNKSIDSYLKNTFTRSPQTYRTYVDHYNAFKRFMGIRRDLEFRDVDNSLLQKYSLKVNKFLTDNPDKSSRTYENYAGSLVTIIKDAYETGTISEPLDKFLIRRHYNFKKHKSYKPNKYHTTRTIFEAITNVNNVEQWQSMGLWLLMFGLRGLYFADIVRLNDKLMHTIDNLDSKDINDMKLRSVANEHLMQDIYLKYGRSKTNMPMIIKVFPIVFKLLNYLKTTAVFTHIDTKVAGKGVLTGMQDRINIFNYDPKTNVERHKQLTKIRQNKFDKISDDQIKFKNARKTFLQLAEDLFGKVEAKMLCGQEVDKLTQESYSNIERPTTIIEMENQHKKVLDAFKYEVLVNKLISKLSDLVEDKLVPNWVLGYAFTKTSKGYKMLTTDFDASGKVIPNKPVSVDIKGRFFRLLSNHKEIEFNVDKVLSKKRYDIVLEKLTNSIKEDIITANKVSNRSLGKSVLK